MTIPTHVPEEEQVVAGTGWWRLLRAQRETEGGQGLNILAPYFLLAVAHLINRRKLKERERLSWSGWVYTALWLFLEDNSQKDLLRMPVPALIFIKVFVTVI